MAIFDTLMMNFGQRLGLDRLAPGPDGVVDLSIESVGRLQLEERADWFLVTLARPVLPHDSGTAVALLQLSHWRENHQWTIHPGMKGDEWFTLTARLPLASVDGPVLEQAIESLRRIFDAAESRG